MSLIHRTVMEPETLESIYGQGTGGGVGEFGCGCMELGEGSMYVCLYHVGFNDGAEAGKNYHE